MDALEDLLKSGRRIRALLHVDVGGVPPDYERLARLTRDHGLLIVEDGAESLGSEVRGRRVGNSPHVATLSFQAAKQLSAAEGGAVTVPDQAMEDRCRRLRNHGMSGRYEHTDFGLNLRISTLNAAVGLAQAERLDHFIERREAIVRKYEEGLSGILTFQPIPEWATRVSWGMCLVRARDTTTRDAIVAGLAREGIETRINWKPIHRQPYHRYLADGEYPVADRIFETSLTLPLGNGMTDETVERICDAVTRSVAS